MDTNGLTPAAVIAWLRDHSAKCARAADELERAFASGMATLGGEANLASSGVQQAATEPPKPKLSERIATLLANSTRRLRPAEIAAELREPEAKIRIALERKTDLFETNDRGWVALKDWQPTS